MSVFGGYGGGGRQMPRVLRFAVRRLSASAPRPDEELQFICSLHEEGTGLAWEYPVRLSATRERVLVDAAPWELMHGSGDAASEHRRDLGTAA